MTTPPPKETSCSQTPIPLSHPLHEKRGRALWQYLGIRMGIANLFLLGLTTLFWPQYLLEMSLGIGLGWVYAITLLLSSHFPLGHMQMAISLSRTVGFAWLLVVIGQFDIIKTTIVMTGLLSYKWLLLEQYARYAWVAVQSFFSFLSRRRSTRQEKSIH